MAGPERHAERGTELVATTGLSIPCRVRPVTRPVGQTAHLVRTTPAWIEIDLGSAQPVAAIRLLVQ